MTDTDTFETQRPTLFGLAYRMLGSASEAEDVVQDAYLRYTAAPRDAVKSPKAFLRTIVTRLCLDQLKAARTTREHYLGPWLPEPLLTVPEDSDPQQAAEQHESITLAFLVLLETLTPQERAVFLLREVFGYEYAEIAELLHLSAANSRQVFHRAKAQIAAHRPRFEPSPARHRQIVERFLDATQQGNLESLTQLLADEVTVWADSGGNVPAPRKPVHGRAAVAKLMVWFVERTTQFFHIPLDHLRAVIAPVNGEPAVLIWMEEQLDSVLVFSIVDAQITGIRIIRNPEKLDYIKRQIEQHGM